MRFVRGFLLLVGGLFIGTATSCNGLKQRLANKLQAEGTLVNSLWSNAQETCTEAMDVVMLLDSSNLISCAHWTNILRAASAFVSKINVGKGQSHVSSVSFSTNTRIDFNLWDPIASNKADILRKLPALRQIKKNLATPLAVQEAINQFKTAEEKRKAQSDNVVRKKLLIVLTAACADEYSHPQYRNPEHQIQEIVKQLQKLAGIHTLVIGIGNGICMDQLRSIANCTPHGSEPCKGVKTTGWGTLKDDAPKFMLSACEDIIKGEIATTTTTPRTTTTTTTTRTTTTTTTTRTTTTATGGSGGGGQTGASVGGGQKGGNGGGGQTGGNEGNADEEEKEEGVPVGAIAGGVVGGVLLLGAAGGGAYMYSKPGGGGSAGKVASAEEFTPESQGAGGDERASNVDQ